MYHILVSCRRVKHIWVGKNAVAGNKSCLQTKVHLSSSWARFTGATQHTLLWAAMQDQMIIIIIIILITIIIIIIICNIKAWTEHTSKARDPKRHQ